MRPMWLLVAVALVAVGLGCSTKSPTAPQQTPAPPPGTEVSATWKIGVDVTERELTVGSTDSATVRITVRRLSDNQPPISGSTLILSTTLGEFNAPASGVKSLVLGTVNGRTEVQFFPGAIVGSARLTAQLEASAGQTAVEIVRAIDPVVADFGFENSNDNLSVQFQNLSTGNPEKFKWEFGDGRKSKDQHPVHLYDAAGDYVVELTVSKRGSEDTRSRIVTVSEDPLFVVEASFAAFVEGLTAVFQDTSTGNPTSWSWDFGDGSRSSSQNPTHVYEAAGTYVVVLKARNSRTSSSASAPVTTLETDAFVTDITPASGPAGGGTAVTIRGQGFVSPLRVFFGGVKATVTSSSKTAIFAITPPGELVTETCDDDGDDIEGTRFFDTAVDVEVELEGGENDTVPGGFVYLSPTGGACVND